MLQRLGEVMRGTVMVGTAVSHRLGIMAVFKMT